MKLSDAVLQLKERGTNSVMESVLDPLGTSLESTLYYPLSEGVYTYETKTIMVDNVETAFYQQYIRSEVIENAHNVMPGFAPNIYGFLWAWGNNSSGQLGDGSATNSSVPVSVQGGRKFAAVSGSSSHLMALEDTGIIWTWGKNLNGQLGQMSDLNNRSSPVSISVPQIFVNISADEECSFATEHLGFGWSWGINSAGQLGDNTINSRSSPTSIVGGYKFVAIKKGKAIDFSNYCWSWGDNTFGQLGDNSSTSRSSPVSVVGLSNVVLMDANFQGHTAFITKDGTLFMCGKNTSGQLGVGSTLHYSSPVSVSASLKFVDVACGADHTLALDTLGYLWVWGNNNAGQLGLGDTANRSSPMSLGVNRYVLIGAKGTSSLAVDTNGFAWSWGDGTNGILGNNNTSNRSRPDSVVTAQIFKTRKAY